MSTLKFSTNWNGKLNSERFFTTLRLASASRHIGDECTIELKNKAVGTAKIQNIYETTFDKLPELYCFLDTGYNLAETKNILSKMYPKVNWQTQRLSIILLKWLKRFE